jgi:hypothetical protein
LRGGCKQVKLAEMLSRHGVRVAEWIGAVIGSIALIVAVGFWVLSRGPISLDWLAPSVTTVFAQAEPGLSARIDHTLLSLDEGPRLKVIAQGLHLVRADGNAELTLPAVSLSLSPRAAAVGSVSPNRITLEKPSLRLLRTEDGEFHLGLTGVQPDAGEWAFGLLEGLIGSPDKAGALGYLSEVDIDDATLSVDDRKLGVTWEAKRADAKLTRQADGISGDLALAIDRGGQPAQLHIDLRYESTAHKLTMGVSFDELRPAVFATASPALKPLGMFDLPLGGQVSLAIDTKSRKLIDFWCDLAVGGGRLVDERFAGGALAVVRGNLRAVYDPATERLELEQFGMVLDRRDGPKLNLKATVEHFDPTATQPLAFAAKLRVRDLHASDMAKVWPENIAIHARGWVLKNVQDGVLTGGQVAFGGTLEFASGGSVAVNLDKVDGNLAYRDVAIQYFPPLTPVHGIEGTAHFDRSHFDLYPTTGVARDVKVSAGAIHLSKLDTDNEEASIDLRVAGPLMDILDELDTKPLRYTHAVGIDPARASGTAEGKLHFRLPLKEALRLDQVEYAAEGQLNDVAIATGFFDRDLTEGSLKLEVSRGTVTLDGTAKLQGVPIALNWVENFAGEGVRTRYKLAGTFSDAMRRKLGFDFLKDYVSGPVGLEMAFAKRRNGDAESKIALDLKNAALDLKRLAWRKTPGTPADAHLTIEAHDGQPTVIKDVAVAGAGLDARFDVALTGPETDAGIASVELHSLTVGNTDASGRVSRRRDGGWDVELSGKSLDVSGLFDDLKNGPPGEKEPSLQIAAKFDRVFLAQDRVARDVRARLYSDGVHWQAASIDAAIGDKAKLEMRYGETAGDRNFRLATEDFGALLRVMDISDKVRSGKLSITGRAEDRDGRRVLRGKFDGSDYRVVNAPSFARLLTLASLSGPAAWANGQGIPFNRVQGDFTLQGDKIELREARAYGEAIGINAGGRYDYRRNVVDFSGTLVPAYMLNSLLGNIPVLGELLMGGKGQGLFAANFHISGPSADPGISVNPLSALAPGFLRRLFMFEPGAPAEDKAQIRASPNGG